MRTDFMTPALAYYNQIMGTTLTITDDTTGSTVADMAVAWLSAFVGYSEEATTHRDRKRGGLFEFEFFEQRAYQVMATIDRTKFDPPTAKNNGLWIPKQYNAVWVNAYIRDDAEDEETYGS